MKSCQNLFVLQGLIMILHIFISGYVDTGCVVRMTCLFFFFCLFSARRSFCNTSVSDVSVLFTGNVNRLDWNHKTWLLLHQICIMRAVICNVRSFPLPRIVALIKTNTRLMWAMPEPRRTLYSWATIIYEAWPRRRLLSECNSACKSQKWNG